MAARDRRTIDLVINAVRYNKKEFCTPYRLNLLTENYETFWNKKKEIGLPIPRIIISLLGDSDTDLSPWYTSAFIEVMLQTIATFGDSWIIQSPSCTCTSTLTVEFTNALEVRKFKKTPLRKSGTQNDVDVLTARLPNAELNRRLRIGFEKYLSRQTVSVSPAAVRASVILFVVDGDLHTLKHVTDSLKNKIPVFAIEGSSQITDVITKYIEGSLSEMVDMKLHDSSDDYENTEAKLWELEKTRQLVKIFNIEKHKPTEMSRVVSDIIETALTDNDSSKDRPSDQADKKKKKLSLRVSIIRKMCSLKIKGQEVQQSVLSEAFKDNDYKQVEELLRYGARIQLNTLNGLYFAAKTLGDDDERLMKIYKSFNKSATQGLENEARFSAFQLIQSILSYVPGTMENGNGEIPHENDGNDDNKDEKTIVDDMDLLLWSVLKNKQELAEIFWSRGSSQIGSALLACAVLKTVSKKALSFKEIELAESLIESSRIFQQNAVDLINELYQQDRRRVDDILQAEDSVELWGIKSDPVTIAHYYNLKDFMSTLAVQSHLAHVWGGCSLTEQIIKQQLPAACPPWLKFLIHYIIYIVFLMTVSYLALTGIHPVTRPYTWPFISTLQWIVVIYVCADIFEEFYSNMVETNGGQTVTYRLKNWVADFWNLLDVSSYILFAMMLVVQFLWNNEKATRRFCCLSLVVFYLRLLAMFIPWKKLGAKVMMIKEMLKDLLLFLPILAVFVLGWGISYHALLYPNHSVLFHGGWENWRIWRMLYLPYWQIYGESFSEEIEAKVMPDDCAENVTVWYKDPTRELCPYQDWMAPIMSSFYILICNLLLVNLVIAMFSHTFQRVEENSHKIWCHYKYSLVQEHRHRIPPPFNILLRPMQFVIWIFKKIKCNEDMADASISEEKTANDNATFLKQGAGKCLLLKKHHE